MSFRISQPKYITAATVPNLIGTNVNIPGYYRVDGVPINNQFYPALGYTYADKDVSNTPWTNRTSPFVSATSCNLNQVAWSPELGLFAVVAQSASNGRIVTSPNGVDWTLRTTGVTLTNVTRISVTNCNNLTGNVISCTSTTNLEIGMNVSTGTPTTSNPTIVSIDNIANTFETSSFIAVSGTTLNTNGFTCTSTTGLLAGFYVSDIISSSIYECLNVYSVTKFRISSGPNFSGNTCFADRQYRDIIWCSDLSGTGMFVANTFTSTGQQIVTSTDGITWINRNTPTNYNSLLQLSYSPTLKRVVCSASGLGLMYSNDGINWIETLNPSTNPTETYSAVTWSSQLGIFVALAFATSTSNTLTSNSIITSTDGINWTRRTGPVGSWGAITWSPELGIFCAMARQTLPITNNIMISSDGINWDNSYATPELNDWRTIVWSSQLRIFFAVANSGTKRFAYSYDGKNWKMITPPTPTIGYRGVSWSPELGIFVSVGVLGSNSTTIATSTLKCRPPTSFNVFDSSFNNINQLGLWNFQSFGRGRPVLKTGNFTVAPGENWIDVSNNTTTVVTLPSASLWPGEELMFKTLTAQPVISNTSNNVILLNGVDASNGIVPGTTGVSTVAGRWSTLVSNGTTWEVMQAS